MSATALTLAAFMELAAACAPGVAPKLLADIARPESGFDPLAIGVNGPGGGRRRFSTAADAATEARRLIAAGRDFDAGVSQINVRNWQWLGLTAESVFDPCANVAASAQVLTALSRYNTGHPTRGMANGYVQRVLDAGRVNDGAPAPAPAPAAPLPPPCAPAWDAWALAACQRRPSPPADGSRATAAAAPQAPEEPKP